MIQPRVSNVRNFISSAARKSGTVKEGLKCVSDHIHSDLPRCAPQTLANMYIRGDEICRSVLSLPVMEKSDVAFAKSGFFNRTKYAREFEKSLQEMKDALFCVENKELVEAIKSTGDLYSLEEVSKIEELVKSGISIDKAVRCRGNAVLLQILDGNVKLESGVTIEHIIEEYVNKQTLFKAKDKNNLFEYTKKINKFISSQGDYIHAPALYRGEQSETQIKRLLSLLAEKQQNPNKTIKYCPNRLLSTTNDLNVSTKDFDYADKCFIKIIGVDGKCKGIDINEILGSKNRFFSQKEILLSSTSEYEVVEGSIQDGRLFVTLKYLH